MKRLSLSLLAILFFFRPTAASQENGQLTWTQWVLGPTTDSYPTVYQEISSFLRQTTSLAMNPERKTLNLEDDSLFSSPLLILDGKEALPDLDDEQIHRLRNYLLSGGFLWIEDSSGRKSSSFNSWVKRNLGMAFPDEPLAPIPSSHVLFRTFFLIRSLGGRILVEPYLQGIFWGRRLLLIYSRNDLLGAWMKDDLGKALFACVPGGEAQRLDAEKLTVNILFYAVTGSYKDDAVHQPYILQKLRAE